MIEELEELVKQIPEKRLLVQVPEGLKHRVREIEEVFKKYGKEPIINIDPVYGACDVRVNEMRMSGCEAIVHIGHAFMTPLPVKVYYVEWKRPLDREKVKKAIEMLTKNRRACVFTNTNFSWFLDEIKDIEGVIISGGSFRMPKKGVVLGCDTTACDVDADINIYIGDGYFHPLAVWINTRRPTYIVYPDGSVEEFSAETLLKRRLSLIGITSGEKVGIIVSSKIGQNRTGLAHQLKKIAEEHGYKASIYISDYIDPSYLEGLDDDFYVYTGCPRVPIDDMDRYKKPLLTPEEFLYKLGLLKKYRIGWITTVLQQDNGE